MNVATPSIGRAVGAYGFVASFVGRCPTLVWNGPLARNFSANGATLSQPGATPQVNAPKTNMRTNGPFHQPAMRHPFDIPSRGGWMNRAVGAHVLVVRGS